MTNSLSWYPMGVYNEVALPANSKGGNVGRITNFADDSFHKPLQETDHAGAEHVLRIDDIHHDPDALNVQRDCAAFANASVTAALAFHQQLLPTARHGDTHSPAWTPHPIGCSLRSLDKNGADK